MIENSKTATWQRRKKINLFPAKIWKKRRVIRNKYLTTIFPAFCKTESSFCIFCYQIPLKALFSPFFSLTGEKIQICYWKERLRQLSPTTTLGKNSRETWNRHLPYRLRTNTWRWVNFRLSKAQTNLTYLQILPSKHLIQKNLI